MHTDKAIFKNTAYQILGKVIGASLSIISFAFLAQYLRPLGMGQYNLVIVYVGFVVVFADFGLNTILTREIAAKKATDEFVSHSFTLRFLLSIAVLLIGSLVVFFLPYPWIVKLGIVIFCAGNLFLLLSAMVWAVFQAELKFGKIVIAQVATAFISAILLIAGSILKLPFLFLVSASSIGMLSGFLISLLLLKRKVSFFLIDPKAFKVILKEAWPFAATAIVSVAYFKIDSLILPFFYDPVAKPDMGYYAMAYKLFEVTIVFGGFYAQTLFPVFSGIINSKNFLKQSRKYLFYSLILSAASVVFLYIFADPMVAILGKQAYLPSIPSVKILSLAAGISILASFFLSIAVAGARQMLLFQFALAAFALNLLLNIFIIPRYSFIGASWTTVLTQLFILLTNVYAAYLVVRKTSVQAKLNP